MKGLSLLQPWASLIVCGSKRIETRSWRTDYRGPLLIHASKAFTNQCQRFAMEQRRLGRLTGETPLGAVVARAVLIDCKPAEELAKTIGDIEFDLGDYSGRRYGFLLADIEPLEPIKWGGCLGLWNVPEKLLERLPEPRTEAAAKVVEKCRR